MFPFSVFKPGQLVHQRYKLQRQLGANAGRQTWLATDEKAAILSASAEDASTSVVIKFLLLGASNQWDDFKLFERETAILQHLNHDRIPQYRDSFSLNDPLAWLALVQDYIPGSSLDQQLKAGRRFTEAEVISIARSILKVLHYLHTLNPRVIHRDIKPSNIILGTDNRLYLVDFGAVQDASNQGAATFTVVGTYGYTPLEQFGGRAVPASDLYALGATLVHLATGITPGDLFGEEGRLQFHDRLSLSQPLVEWLDRLTDPWPQGRFSTAQAALQALDDALEPIEDPDSDGDSAANGSALPALADHPSSHRAAIVRHWSNRHGICFKSTASYLTITVPARGLLRPDHHSDDQDPKAITTLERRAIFLGAVLLIIVPLVPFSWMLGVSNLPTLLSIGLGGAIATAFFVAWMGHNQTVMFSREQFRLRSQLFNWIVWRDSGGDTRQIAGVFLRQRRVNPNTVQEICIRLHNGAIHVFTSTRLSEADSMTLVQEMNMWLHDQSSN